MWLKGKRSILPLCGVAAGVLAVTLTGWGQTTAKENAKWSLRAPNGIHFGLIKGYEHWEVVAMHYRPDMKEMRYILGNPLAVQAYRQGIPQNGHNFPTGAILVKIGYSLKPIRSFPSAIEPNVLQRVEFMVRDPKFKSTGGWGFARFVYHPATKTYTPYGQNASFAQECFNCHAIVKNRDFVFTSYVPKG
ncbi:hypothetical protein CTKA_01557 [Chthonomonas calidirosea]|uniref:Cytochrome P460 domain-containing protein n=1 Tax=Chthonomonas calidirosea (strain DSM 23976 / ICMP 18418 / T49) TaxID=1303518 RepID=S0EX77_CHTCT|nr:cytochrome P460 family protein [Chthonomonas calidirosea]CCW36331.1 hypothetical protein CCALI_02534 [Chthonomonas calidirosea T49]CEK17650.1 hypothetical protein CTKA_01557 [Chthonomonas calidirosea]